MLRPFEQDAPLPKKKRRTETLVASARSYVIAQLRGPALQPGSRIDDPEIVAARLSIPPKEARMAYGQLTADGYIKKLRGFGYVAQNPWAHDDRVRLPDIADVVWAAGCEFSADVISKASEGQHCPPPPIAAMTSSTFYSAVLFYANERPVQLSRWWVSSRRFIGYRSVALRLTRTLTYLRRAAPHLSASHSISAILADDKLGSQLEVNTAAPCLQVLTRVEIKGELVAVGEDISPSSRLRFPDQILSD